ncbi:hypothetical protein A2767_03250 [Candidatus Roizmanbacteria bacterium RIFCSPHIGHO2_01_FULL_35_10]|uniref:PsbP C-terminal domain-containing protein n=1 Tax=Candidatus Roizmanbacteria bacterium RIFCSPLOWO2_01_FULL_35_13 TaxID=1802055 RepID=A0A1F7ID91_9BACT|nr:MAG: hypothetical protein A2767_03250 [Candidatus Roizmanbacteria bacterium RIFCSPHIGHO2_01_FULL_35_10]OGK41339.1 MAG: hypothetical protein A3A74_03325 [Candidatus Roizmanbacteria bacterium RIFCSPLOWO2_01_FULL_35_13]
MDINNANQPVNPPITSVQNPIPEHQANNQRGSFPLIAGVLVLLLVVGGGAYYLGTQKNNSINQATNINTKIQTQPSPTKMYSEPSPTTVTTKNGMIVFEHPKVNYTLEYPASWKGKTEPIPQAYEVFIARSADYQLSDGYPVLEKGAEFYVSVENSTEKSIDDIFNKDPLTLQIAYNKIKIIVDGVEAIQYDYSYEGYNVTMTTFLKNGKYYTIHYRYVDNAGKQLEWNTYLNLLKSFKTK